MKINRSFIVVGFILFGISFLIESVNIYGLFSTQLKGYEAFLAALLLDIESENFFYPILLKTLSISNFLILATPFIIKKKTKAKTAFFCLIYLFMLLQLSLAITSSLDESSGYTLIWEFYFWTFSYFFVAISLIEYSTIKMLDRNSKT